MTSQTTISMSDTEVFVRHRPLLFTIAYEMLGSAADAEDILQETWLRWNGINATYINDHRAYLVRIATRQALNRLRTLKRQRETYIGPWLPEPILTGQDVADDAELAESVSMALMYILELLSPTERAVFVLREAFDYSHNEIASAIDKSPAAVRQIAHRARKRVDARRPRTAVSPTVARETLESFHYALETGDLQTFLDVLSPEVVIIADGGGVRHTAVRPIIGAENVARYLVGGLDKAPEPLTADGITVNGNPAFIIRIGKAIDGVLAFHVEDRLIAGIFYVRNPAKLDRLESEVQLSLR